MKKKFNITNKAIKNQKLILVISVLCLVTLFIGTSYSLLTNFDNYDKNVTTIENNGYKLSVNKTKNVINLTGMNPLNDEEGMKTKPITFTISNSGNKDINNLKIKLVKSKDKKTTLDEAKIKFSISIDAGHTFSDPHSIVETDNAILYMSNFEKGKTQTFYLRVWVNGDETDNSVYYGSLEFEF